MKRLVLAMAVLCAAGTAQAQPRPSPAFTQEYQAGVDAFRLGQLDEAIRHLTAAAQLEPKLPGPHRFLAAVAAQQQRWGDCIAAARTAIELNPQSAEIVATRQLHDDCREADGRPGFTGDYAGGGALTVNANISGATVEVSGLKYGATPLAPRALALGEVTVKVTKPGWKAAETTTVILPGIVTDVTLTLEEDAVVDPGGGDPADPAAVDVGWLRLQVPPGAVVTFDGATLQPDERGRYELAPTVIRVRVEAPDKVPETRDVRISKGQEVTATFELESRGAVENRRRTGRIAVIAAVGLGAVGAVTGVLAMRANDDARDAWTVETTRPTTVPLSESAQVAQVHTRAEVQDMVDRGKRWSLVSNISYGAAAVAAGVGIYFLARAPDEKPPRAAIVPVVGEAWGVSVSGRFP